MAALGLCRGGGLRPAARRDSLDRQRNRRARPTARAGPDLRHQPVHAGRRRRRAWRRAGAATGPPTTPWRTSPARWTRALQEDLLVFSGGSSVGRTRPDSRRPGGPGRGDLSRHRGQAGQADGFRPRSRESCSSACRATPTSCLSNAYILLAPALRRMARLAPQPSRSVTLPLSAADHVGAGPASVLYGQDRGRRGGARLQGLRRHHEHVAGGRIHRDPCRHRSPSSRATIVEVKLF